MTATTFDAEGAICNGNPAADGARTSPEASPNPDESSAKSAMVPASGILPKRSEAEDSSLSPRTTEHPEGGGDGPAPSPLGDALFIPIHDMIGSIR